MTYHAAIDLTGDEAVPANTTLEIPNPVGLKPDVVFVETISGDPLTLTDAGCTAEIIEVSNTNLVDPAESKLLVEYWHSISR